MFDLLLLRRLLRLLLDGVAVADGVGEEPPRAAVVTVAPRAAAADSSSDGHHRDQ